jgi:hypothetical protein
MEKDTIAPAPGAESTMISPPSFIARSRMFNRP